MDRFLNKRRVLYIANWFDIKLTITSGQYKRTDIWVETDGLHHWIKLENLHTPEYWMCGDPQPLGENKFWRNWS